MMKAVIFDVDGVLLASPHERAWREALGEFADPALFTDAFYQAHVAGKPRLDGARRALEHLGVPDAATRAAAYAARKQALMEQLIAAGEFAAFADAKRAAVALKAAGLKLATASSSKNAAAMLRHLGLTGLFDADVSGRDVPGKPDPTIFLLAARALGEQPDQCLVIEDAPAGIEAARAGGMATVGIARLDDAALLQAAGADIVLTSLDELDAAAVASGAQWRKPAHG